MNIGDGARLQRRRGQGTRAGTDTFVLQGVLPGRAGCEQKFGRDPGSVSAPLLSRNSSKKTNQLLGPWCGPYMADECSKMKGYGDGKHTVNDFWHSPYLKFIFAFRL